MILCIFPIILSSFNFWIFQQASKFSNQIFQAYIYKYILIFNKEQCQLKIKQNKSIINIQIDNKAKTPDI